MFEHLQKQWWLLTLRGVLTIISGLIAILAPGIVIITLLFYFGFLAIYSGIYLIIEGIRIKESDRGMRILEGIFYILTGILRNSIYKENRFQNVYETGALIEWLAIFNGVITALLGVLVLLNVFTGAQALIMVFGIFSIISGILMLMLSFKIKNLIIPKSGPILKPGAAYSLPEESTEKDVKPPIKIVGGQVENVKDEKYISYEVFFGTNRKIKNKNNWNDFYGTDRSTGLEYGLCKVSIPIQHKRGELERPNWFVEKIFEENPKKHFVVLGVYPKPEKNFLELLKNKIKQVVEDEALIFIHGYNVSFAESMRRTAQLGYDLSFRGIVLGYSWPSQGKKAGYLTDIDSAKISSDYLIEFLKLIISTNKISKLHIIAHSMGNVVLTEALIKLKNDNIKLPEINQVILAAPDIDKDVFKKNIVPNILIGPRYTLYASSQDKILILSKKIRSGYDRVGEGGEKLFLTDGIETIDASTVDTSLLGHGYFSEAISLINDIHGVLNGEPPIKRLLNQKEKKIGEKKILYWIFPNTR